jgi:hypothetical protein
MRIWMAAKMWLWSYFTTWQRLVPTESLHTRRVGTFQEDTQPVTKRGNAPPYAELARGPHHLFHVFFPGLSTAYLLSLH